jgi:small ligand-binding sensory domain FIST
MSLIDNTVPYEILVRFDEEGIPKGAQVQYRRIVVLDGERLKDEPLAAQPLDLAGLDVSDLIGSVAAAALARVTELEREIAILTADRASAEATVIQ